jgi:hypothetical protein
MAASLRATVLPYKTQLVPSELTTVKLKQDFQGGSSKDKKCPVFTGEHGIEALLYVEERFRKIASRTLEWTTGQELFDGFEEVLLDTALMNWEDLTSTIADADKTPARFDQTLQALYRKYVGAEARDTQFEYFRTLQKPMKASTLDHASRMLTLARYGNKLPGAEPPLTSEQIKKCIFASFPLLWQQQYIRSGQRVANTPLSDIIEFMSNEKLFADTQNSARALDKKKPFQQKDDSGAGSFKKRKFEKGKNKNTPYKKVKETNGLKPDSECPIHGGHPWNKCFDNPQGENYKPRGADGHRPGFAGRGRGRGFPSAGRGNGNGGGGNCNGRGAGQYSFQAAKATPAAEDPVPVAAQHHFDQIGKDPNWGWDEADDAKPPGE